MNENAMLVNRDPQLPLVKITGMNEGERNRHACGLGTAESLDFGYRPTAKVFPCVEAAALPWRGLGPARQHNFL